MYNGEKLIDRPLRWGMVGGGRTGQVGYKHRTGALRDNTAYRLVCGAFDIDAERGRDFGRNLGVAEERLYPDYKTLIAEEAKRDDGVEVVTVATPNFSHYEITKALLEAGIHVICEKPLFFTVGRVRRDRGARRGEGPDRRRHLRLHRPSAGPPDGGDGEEGDARRHPHGRPAVHPRLQRRRRRGRPGRGEVAHQSEDLRPDLRARRHRHAHLLPQRDRAAAHEDRAAALRPAVVHQVARAAGGQRLCPVALRQRRGRPPLGAPRSTPATWAASATASSARRPRSSGPTATPTS